MWPKKSPAAFTWLAERAVDQPDWLARNPLRFVKQIIWSMTSEAFAPFKAARRRARLSVSTGHAAPGPARAVCELGRRGPKLAGAADPGG